MSGLILEIDRMREIMGLGANSKLIISEQVSVLSKLLRDAEIALKDVDDNKALIKQLDNLKPKGVTRLTAKEIDDLAEKLAREASNISTAMKTTGFETASRLSGAAELNRLIRSTARREADSLINLYITKSLDKVFENTTGTWNKAYSLATLDTEDMLQLYQTGKTTLTEDELIRFFKTQLEENLKKTIDDFKWSNYPEFERWSMKSFNDVNGTLDNIIKNNESYITVSKSKNRFETYQSAKLETDTKLIDIQKKYLSNFRYLQGWKMKIQNIFKRPSAIESFEKNVALLKGFPTEQIFREVNNKTLPNEAFAALVRNVAFDIEQMATWEKNTLEQWKSLMDEVGAVDPELVKGMNEVPIFKEKFGGWLWQEENLKTFIDRLKLKYEGDIVEGGGFWGTVLEETKEIGKLLTLSKTSLIASTTNIIDGAKGFVKGVATRRFFSSGLWGVPFTPKQLGLMLSRRGYGTLPLIQSFLEAWFILQVWQNMISSFVAILQPFFNFVCEKTIGAWLGVNCTDDQRTIRESWKESLTSIWLDYSSYLNIGFEPGFLIDFGSWFMSISDEKQDQTTIKLIGDKDTALKKLWESIPENNQERLLKSAEEVSGSDFQNFSRVTSTDGKWRVFYQTFMKKNNLTPEEVNKIRESRVMSVAKETNLGLTTDDLKNMMKNTNSFDVEKYLKVGGVKDKNDVVYKIKRLDTVYDYQFIPPDKEIRFGAQPVGNNDSFYIYRDETDKEVERLSAEQLKNLGFNSGYDEQGLFTSKDKAKEVRDALQNDFPAVPQKPITIQELLKRL